jgi:hypothetical protein
MHCSVAIRLVGGGAVGLAWSATFPTRTANRPAQELGLLVLLRGEAVAAAEITTGLLLTAGRFDALRARLTRWWLRILLIGTAFGAVIAIVTVTAIVAIIPLVAVAVAIAAVVVVIIVVIEVAVMLAIAAVTVLVLAAAVVVVALVIHARLMIVAHLRLVLRLHIAVITFVVAVVLAIHRIARRGAAVQPVATLGDLLVAEGHDDAVVVLGVLQIVLSQHRIARGCRIAGERHVLFGDV